MITNCPSEIEKKAERIRMVLYAAREILEIAAVKGEEIQTTIQPRVFGGSVGSMDFRVMDSDWQQRERELMD